MKKIIILLLFSFKVLAQSDEILSDSSMFLGITKQYTFLLSEPRLTGTTLQTLSGSTSVAVISYVKPFWKVMRDSTIGYIEEIHLTIDSDRQVYLKYKKTEGEDVRIKSAKMLANVIMNKEKNDLLKTLKSYEKKGFAVTSWSFSDHDKYSSALDASIEIFNPTKKTIKYVWFTLTAYNPVGDIVGKPKTVNAIGPVKPYEGASWDFEYVFFSKVVDCMRISKIKIQYVDGTFREYPNPNLVMAEGEKNNCK